MAVVRWDRARATGPVDPMAIDDLDGDVLVLEGVIEADDGSLGWVRSAPCVVIGRTPRDRPPSRAVDLEIGEDADGAELGRVVAAVEAHPAASRTLVDVLRAAPDDDVRAGLAVESLAYSTLLAGPEFAGWLASRPRPAPRRFGRPPVRAERRGQQLHVVLDRPENRNAFSAAMRDGLLEALGVAEVDPSITEVLVSAEGPAFSSGGDLTEFGTTPDVVRAHQIRTQRSVGAALARLAPRVAVHVHGACVGAGIELPAFAGRVVADPATTFRLPEIGMGLIPGAGGTVSIRRRIGRQALAKLALLGEELDAPAALRMGLVDELSDP